MNLSTHAHRRLDDQSSYHVTMTVTLRNWRTEEDLTYSFIQLPVPTDYAGAAPEDLVQAAQWVFRTNQVAIAELITTIYKTLTFEQMELPF